ncbi:MAG TPA: FAD-dependent oxidoreductase [Chitinophagaceae bacterium]|nr:FAD-dependent oxidoreductase [Chitinophagaceae bacterium]
MKVTIIGGGVIGLCCAYYLNKEGYEITVIDRNDINDGCSFGNMGYISPSHFTPLASPGIISQGLKWMLSSSSPFYIKPRLNWDLLQWGMAFWKNSNAKKVKENIPHLNNLLQLSRELMTDIKNEFKESITMIERGCWMLYKEAATGEHEKHLAEQAEKLGLRTVVCSRNEVQQYEPEVEVDVAGGVLYQDDCHINPTEFMHTLHHHLQNSGVTFLLNTEVKGFLKNHSIAAVITNNGIIKTDEVVVANGSWMPDLAKLLGIKMLMQPGKGYSIVYNGLEKNLHYPSILVDDRTATTPIDRWLRIGGTMEMSSHSDNILPKRITALYQAFKKYYPNLEIPPPQIEKAWFGYRPVTPDGLPYIGKHQKFHNLAFAGGHAMLGVSAAAATGKLVSEIISRRPSSIDLSAFGAGRFS